MSTAQEVITIESGPMQPIPVQSEGAAVIGMIERALGNPAVDVDKLRQLMEMRERVEARRDERAFDDAMAQAQADMRRISADCSNPQTHSRYASYAALDRALRPIYTRYGFSVSFDNDISPKGPDYVRVLAYVGCQGHRRTYKTDMPVVTKGPKGNDVMTPIHATGSANTYGKRYLLIDIFNLAIGDDDGNAAGDSNECITAEQVGHLQTAIVQAGADIQRFLKYFKIDDLADLPVSKLKGAYQMLEAKMANEAKRGQQ